VSSRPTPVAAPAAADGLADRRLETLAQALAEALPCTDRVSIAVLGLLATGRPVGRRDIAAALSGAASGVALAEAEAVVSAAVRRMPHLELDADGRIVGCGLTLVPTDHRIVFTGPPLYTWCAFDAVLFPVMLGRRAEIRSLCHATGVPVRCSIGPDGAENVAPAAAAISLVVPEPAAACCDVRGSFCDHVHFFASPAVASTWRAAHANGQVVSVSEAHTIAGRIRALRGGEWRAENRVPMKA
jgi:alkylmercury lyase